MAPLALVCPNPKAPLALERAFDFGQKNAACPAPGSGQTPNAQQAVRRRTCLARAGLLSDSDSDIVVVVAVALPGWRYARENLPIWQSDGRDSTPHTTLGLAHRA
jgi:hypothetical protein